MKIKTIIFTLCSLLILTSISHLSYCQTTNNYKDKLCLVPQPKEIIIKDGIFELNNNTLIVCKNRFNREYLKKIINSATKYNLSTSDYQGNKNKNIILFQCSNSYDIPEEGYEIDVTPDKIEVRSSSSAGEFYAIQTLLQLLPTTIYGNTTGMEDWTIPSVEIKDSPRFSYRGFMLDVSRTFFKPDVIYNIIDWLSYHKINKFHWHLIDDNGWRIEIKKYPFLTEKGGWRGPNEVLPPAYGSGNKKYGGYYTQKEIKEIVKYASDRNIEIIPEIDMPGHSKSVTSSYPNTMCDAGKYSESVNGETFNAWCVGYCEETNYKMIDNIIKEIASLFPGKTVHVGGDEVNFDIWKQCKKCQELMKSKDIKSERELQDYFMKRVSKIIGKYGKNMAGWDEIITVDDLPKNTISYAWNSVDRAKAAAEKGIYTVTQICQYLYFDMKQSQIERGHQWAAIINLEKAYNFDPVDSVKLRSKDDEKYILGPQSGLWCELLNRPKRFLEYQTWPRNAALAEIGWTEKSKKNFSDFEKRLSHKHYERMFNMGIAFRVPYPEVTYEDYKLKVRLPYDWMAVRYTTDGTEPNISSPIYTGDIVTYEPLKFKFASFYKDVLKSITVQAGNINIEYLKPEVKVTASYEVNPKFPFTNVENYNFNKYSRSKISIKNGDWVLYTFTNPVECSKITVEVGIPNITAYGLTDGHVEYSYDGIDYINGANFKDNIAVITPDKPIKAVRIVSDGYSDGGNLSIQNLRIER